MDDRPVSAELDGAIMAKEAPKADAAPAPAPAEQAPKKKLPLKTIIMVLVMLVGEAAIIVALMSMMGKPSEVKGVQLVEDQDSGLDKLQEVPVVEERYTNTSSGRLFIFDTEIIAQVKARHAEAIATELEERRAEVRTGIGAIFASAQQSYFNEPNRETLTRQVLEYLRGVFGEDEQGHQRVEAVLIPKCLGFPMDG